MPFAVTKLPQEPIAIVHVELPILEHIKAILGIRQQVYELANSANAPFFAIIDLRRQEPEFADALIWIEECQQFRAAARHPIHKLIVGSHPMIDVGVRRIAQRLQLNIPVFDTIEAALIYARQTRPDDED